MEDYGVTVNGTNGGIRHTVIEDSTQVDSLVNSLI